MKQKMRNTRNKSKAAKITFSLRDTWDIMVIVVLLSSVVYFSYYVRNNQSAVSVWPQIQFVKVNGKLTATNRIDFKKIIRKRIAGGFFRVPMDQLEQELAELPWVYRANVERFWPNTLTVTIYEQNPIARWGDVGLLNAYGEVFFPESTDAYASLPLLFGEQLRAKDLARVFENSMQQLKPLNLQLRGLFEDRRQSKHLVFSNGLVLTIGDGDVSEKITRFITAYEQYLSPYLAEVKKIDLRYTNGLAVEWKNPHLANNLELERNL